MGQKESGLAGFLKFMGQMLEEHGKGKSVGKATEDQYLLMGQLEEISENTKSELDEKVNAFVESLKSEYQPIMKQQKKDIELLWEEILTDLDVPKEKHDEMFQLNRDTGEVTQLSGIEVETDEGSYKPLSKEQKRYSKDGQTLKDDPDIKAMQKHWDLADHMMKQERTNETHMKNGDGRGIISGFDPQIKPVFLDSNQNDIVFKKGDDSE